ncbi:hypothetical protein FOCC_FOCC014165 [Frankliniella occidentalis]|nr:hypothetical protein FOCC_FOCC014165 [Frankliniella occidentalis]
MGVSNRWFPEFSPDEAENLFVQMGEYVLRFESEDFGKEYEERARLELRETPESTKEACEKLREILKADAELDVPYEEENFLVTFLRPTHFYPESAYERMQNFFKFKVKYPKYCANLIPSRERNVFEQGILTVFPNRDHLGRRVLLIEAGTVLPGRDLQGRDAGAGGGHLRAADAGVRRAGHPGHGRSRPHARVAVHSGLRQGRRGVGAGERPADCIPVRLKGVHIINQPYVFNMVFAIFKPLLNAKLRNRIHFHGTDRQSLLNHVDAKCLPKTYGGEVNIPEFPGGKLCDLLSNYDSHYEMRNQNGYSKKT